MEQISQANFGSTSHNTCGNRTLDPNNCNWENTYALDSPGGIGRPVIAMADGIVAHYDDNPAGLGGREVGLDHGGGNYSQYMHLSQVLVKKGEVVKRGQVIALLGNSSNGDGGTSPHLHFHLYSGSGSWNSHTSPFECLVLKRDGVDPDFRCYNSSNGDLNSSQISWSDFWSDNTNIFDQAYTAYGSIPLSNYGWWKTWVSGEYDNVYYADVIDNLPNGYVVYDAMRGARSAVHIFGQMWIKWATNMNNPGNGPVSYLGAPIGPEYTKNSLTYQDFQGGYIVWNGSVAMDYLYPEAYGPGAFDWTTQATNPRSADAAFEF